MIKEKVVGKENESGKEKEAEREKAKKSKTDQILRKRRMIPNASSVLKATPKTIKAKGGLGALCVLNGHMRLVRE